MADNIRQRIMTALDTRLSGILVASGYATNAGQHVFGWRVSDIQESELPAIVYRDGRTKESEPVIIMGADSKRDYPLIVELDLHGTSGTATPEHMRSMIADVIKAIGVDPTWGGLAVMTELLGDEMDMAQADRTIAIATMSICITYRTKLWDPLTT